MKADPLRDIWSAVYAYARRRRRSLPKLTLRIGCPRIAAMRRTDPRAFMHVGEDGKARVCSSPAARKLSVNYLVGLYLHEIGHVLAQKAWKRSEQEDADKAVRDFLGVRLHYRGPLLLEWVTDSAVRRVMGK